MTTHKQPGPMDGFNVRMTAWHQLQARRIGGGNMGEGVRIAIEIAEMVLARRKDSADRQDRRRKDRREF